MIINYTIHNICCRKLIVCTQIRLQISADTIEMLAKGKYFLHIWEAEQ